MDLRAARSGVTGAKTGAVIVVQRTSMVRLPGAASIGLHFLGRRTDCS
jgi:hypothetical protein